MRLSHLPRFATKFNTPCVEGAIILLVLINVSVWGSLRKDTYFDWVTSWGSVYLKGGKSSTSLLTFFLWSCWLLYKNNTKFIHFPPPFILFTTLNSVLKTLSNSFNIKVDFILNHYFSSYLMRWKQTSLLQYWNELLRNVHQFWSFSKLNECRVFWKNTRSNLSKVS